MFVRWQLTALAALGAVGLAGCGDLDFGRTGGPVGNEAQTAADMAAGLDGGAKANNQAAGGGETDSHGPVTAMPTEENPAGSIVGKTTDEILNAAELKNDPESGWKIIADDPAKVRARTAAGTAYHRAAALSATANLTKWLQMQHALNGKYPSYEELMAYREEHPANNKMPTLPQDRAYGYDETTGQMVVLKKVR